MPANRTSVVTARSLERLVRWIAVPIVIAMILATVLCGHDRLAFRDVSHFYTPLYEYVALRCQSQWLPLWNPLDQTGIPLVGETTTAVFYPLRYLLFALPIAASTAMAWYVAIHLMIASVTAQFTARSMGVAPRFAFLASIAYPLSGSVWFLYTNPPYLISAAWMPLAIATLLSRRLRPATRVVVTALALAMMILGGDPQTALHTLLVAAPVLLARCVRTDRSRLTLLREDGCVWLLAPILAAMLTAPQIAASVAWSRQSSRAQPPVEVSRWAPPAVGGKTHQAYQFSLPPWHLTELLTPNPSGSLLPIYRRVSQWIPGDGRVWTPTIYMGLLVMLAVIDRIGRWRTDGINAPLAILMVSLALSCGHFGILWWIQASTGTMSQVDSAVGGPYWWLYQFLPGYDAFRYPTKWLIFASLGGSVIAAQWVQQVHRNRQSMASQIPTIGIAAMAIVVGWGLWWAFGRWTDSADGVRSIQSAALPSDLFWGPLDVAGGLAEIRQSLIHSSIALTAIITLLIGASRGALGQRRFAFAMGAILIADLWGVAAGMTYRVDVTAEDAIVETLSQNVPNDVHRWMRTKSGTGWPDHWQQESSPDRLFEVEASQRSAWFGRWHLAGGHRMFNNMVSIESQSMAAFWDRFHVETDGMNAAQIDQWWDAARSIMAIDAVVQCTQSQCPLEAAIIDDRVLVDIHRAKMHSGDSVRRGEVMLRDDANVVQVNLSEPSAVIRPVLQDGSWIARARRHTTTVVSSGDRALQVDEPEWQAVEVTATRGLVQQVKLPAGDWTIQFEYAPGWVTQAIPLAAVAWIAIGIFVCRQSVVGRKTRR